MIIFYQLNYFFLPLAYIFSLFKFQIVYFELKLPKEKILNSTFLSKKVKSFTQLNYLLPHSSYKIFCDYPYYLTRPTVNHIYNKYKKIIKKINLGSEKEVKAIFFQKLLANEKLVQLVYFTRFLKKKKVSFVLFAYFTFLEIIVLKSNNINLYKTIFQIIGNVFKVLDFIIKKFKNFYLNTSIKNKYDFVSNQIIDKNFKPEVIFYPHHTTDYGRIYKKTMFYSKNKDSKFFKENILHIELVNNEKFRDFYIFKKLNFFFHGKTNLRNIFPICFSLPSLFFLYEWIFVLKFIATYRKILSDFDNNFFKNVKYCLIGNDITFDNLISLILKKKNIVTIGFQSRWISSKWKIYSNILDTLLVLDEYSKKNFEKQKYCIVSNYIVSGPLIDNLKKISHSKINNTNNIICYDWPPGTYSYQSLNLNTDSSQIFYEDILSLSERYNNYNFIIKSKEIIEGFDYEKKLKDRIVNRSNVYIFNDNKSNINFKNLYSNCNIIITKPSSTIDHGLLNNKVVLVHDYAKNFNILLRKYENFNNQVYFSNSHKELHEKFDFILENNVIKRDKFNINKKYYFNDNKVFNLEFFLNNLGKKNDKMHYSK